MNSQESGACKPLKDYPGCVEAQKDYPGCVEAQQFLCRVLENDLGTISFSMKQRSVRDLVKRTQKGTSLIALLKVLFKNCVTSSKSDGQTFAWSFSLTQQLFSLFCWGFQPGLATVDDIVSHVVPWYLILSREFLWRGTQIPLHYLNGECVDIQTV